MWEAIEKILISNNGILIALLFLILIVLIIFCSRFGLIKIKTDKLTIGRESSELERTIMRNQIEYVEMSIKAFEQRMPKPEGYNVYRGKYITERAFDEIVKWIAFNHIRTDDHYIQIKQASIWNLVQSLTEKNEFQDDSFKESVDKFVVELIKNLVAIRKEYSKEL